MKAYLRRFFRKNTSVFGMLHFEDFSIFTIENFMKIIPAGEYSVQLSHSPKFSAKIPYKYFNGVPELLRVPGRSGIRIHCGNYDKDVVGCIAVGNGIDLEKPMVNNSRAAYVKMIKYLQSNRVTEFELEIADDYATII